MTVQTKTRLTLVIIAFAGALLVNDAVVSAQFTEAFGHIGMVRALKGQVRDSLDQPIPQAKVKVKNLASNETYLVDADDDGVFRKDDLPDGEYLVSATGSAFNITEYTLQIKRKDSHASNKYMIVRLSPGCSWSNSGVKLVRKLSDRSIH
jgi:hypothetical protein